MKLPRFTQVRKLADGTKAYRFNPPQKFINAGVVSRIELGDDFKYYQTFVPYQLEVLRRCMNI